MAAIIVVAISLLSTFTISSPENASSTEGAGADDSAAPSDDPGGNDPSGDDAGGETSQPGRPGSTTRTVGGDGPTAGSSGTIGGSTGGRSGTRGSEGSEGRFGVGKYNCGAGENAGDTDTPGVGAGEIRLGATVVKTGIAKAFLSDAQFGIEAVVQKTNRNNGVCGRLLKVDYEDDGWNTAKGNSIISKWIGGKRHFGLIVNPSSEGLRGAIDGKLIDSNKFPVVGADGMLAGQYLEDWVWPVATSTYSVMHIMARKAIERGAKRLGIVAETNYRFGYEGLIAFKAEVERICSDCVVLEEKIKGGELSYRNQANSFLQKCSSDFSKCDFVALLLEPATASQWVKDNGLGDGEANHRPKYGIGAPQPLFVNSFIRQCRKPCADLEVWTSFKPPIHPFDRDPDVARYVNDLRAVSSSADASNPHVQGAYVGARLLVEALKDLPAPTPDQVRQVLDGMTFDSKLAPPLKFSAGNHFAAVSAQSFTAIFNGTNFSNWLHNEDFIVDKSVRADLDKLD